MDDKLLTARHFTPSRDARLPALRVYRPGPMRRCTESKKAHRLLLAQQDGARWLDQRGDGARRQPPAAQGLPPDEPQARRPSRACCARTWQPTIPLPSPAISGLAFLDEIAPAEALPLLQQRRSALAEELASTLAAPAHTGSVQLVLEHQRHHLSAELAWLDGVHRKTTSDYLTSCLAAPPLPTS